MKKYLIGAVTAGTILALTQITSAAVLNFDRQLDVGGIAIVSSICPASTSGGHMVYDLVDNGASTRLSTVGNIVAFHLKMPGIETKKCLNSTDILLKASTLELKHS